jgi:hypothetical protein
MQVGDKVRVIKRPMIDLAPQLGDEGVIVKMDDVNLASVKIEGCFWQPCRINTDYLEKI